MKKFMIVFLFVVLLVGCNPSGGDNERPSAIVLNGESTITLSVGDTYSELGAFVKDDSSITVIIDSNIDTSIAGTYYVEYSYETDGVTIKTKRTVIVEEDVVVLGEVILNGTTRITLTVGDTYQELGAYVDGDTSIAVLKTGTVNTDFAATYTLTYSYTVDGVTKSATRTVIVEEMETISCTLDGLENMEINVGDSYTESGLTCSPTSTVITIDDSELNINVVGIYNVTYTYFDGTSNVTLTRTVEVVQPVYYVLDSSVLTGDTLTVSITGYDVTLKYTLLSVELYKDDVFVETQQVLNGVNTLTFLSLDDGHDYVVKIRGDYMDGINPMVDEEVLDSFTIESLIVAPTMTVSNEFIGTNSFSFDYDISDTESRFLWFDVKVYEGTNLIDDTNHSITTTSGSIDITDLDDYNDYHIDVILTYDEGTTNLETKGLDEDFTTVLDFSISVEPEHEMVYQNDNNKLVVTLTNPNSHTVDSIYINGSNKVFTVVNATTIEIELDTSVLGEFDMTIDQIVLDIRGTNETFVWDTDFTHEVVDEIDPSNIPYVMSYFSNDDNYDTSSSGSGHTMQLELYNPLQLEISNIYLDGVLLGSGYIYSNTGEVLTFYDNFGGEQKVTQFSYEFGGVVYVVDVNSFNIEHIPYCGGTIHQVSTVQDVKDMVTNPIGCYELNNNVDLTGEDWVTVLSSAPNSGSLTLFGNGHTISNVTMSSSDISNNSNSYWGLFRYLGGAHIEDLSVTVDISLGNSYSGSTYIGGLAGRIDNSHIENVDVSGTINSNWFVDGYIGGLSGFGYDVVAEDISTSVTLTVSQHTPAVKSVVGSMFGEVDSAEIYGYSDSGTVTITGITSHANLYSDEPIAVVANSDVEELPGQ